MVFLMLCILLLAVTLFMLIRTFVLREHNRSSAPQTAPIEESRARQVLSQAVGCPTISRMQSEETDWSAFDNLGALLAASYPRCESHRITEGVGSHNLVYRFEGTDSGLQPALLTAHLDVVPVQESQWSHPPFSGIIEDGYLWGRGSFDCKLQVVTILQAFETRLETQTGSKRTWYVAFGCDEECNSLEQGASSIAAYFERQNIRFSLVLDEGGVVSERYIEGFSQSIAVVGIAEKGYLDLELSTKRSAGHSSTPAFPTALGSLSRALAILEQKQMHRFITYPVKQMLTHLGKEGPFACSLLFLNLTLTKHLLFAVFSKSPTLNALIRTTVVPTVIHASDQSNVIAQEAKAQVNIRLLGDDTPQKVVAWMHKVLKDPSIQIRILRFTPPSNVSRVDDPAFMCIKQTIQSCFPDALVAPYLMLGATDARKYQHLCDAIYRFTPARMEKSEVQRMHAPDERISLDNIDHAVGFYRKLIHSW